MLLTINLLLSERAFASRIIVPNNLLSVLLTLLIVQREGRLACRKNLLQESPNVFLGDPACLG